eukprot:3373742-Rhodomonas_salina.1
MRIPTLASSGIAVAPAGGRVRSAPATGYPGTGTRVFNTQLGTGFPGTCTRRRSLNSYFATLARAPRILSTVLVGYGAHHDADQ